MPNNNPWNNDFFFTDFSFKAFYERDDVSRMSPNVKHCKKFEDPSTGTKEFKQIRFLMYTLSDVYEMFKKQAVQNGEFITKIFFFVLELPRFHRNFRFHHPLSKCVRFPLTYKLRTKVSRTWFFLLKHKATQTRMIVANS